MPDSIFSGADRRERVFKMLFSREYNTDNTIGDAFASFFDAEEGAPSEGYVRDTFFGASEFAAETDHLVESDSKNWKMSRMSPVTRSILHLAVYEIMKTDVPPRVAINEAVELAKKFGEDGAPSFVNGILNRIAKDSGKI